MSNDWDPLFLPPTNSQTEPDYDAVQFQSCDEQYLAVFFPFTNDLSDEERKEQAETWISHRNPHSNINTVMWLDSAGKVQLFDQEMKTVRIEECTFNVKTLRPEVVLKDIGALERYKNGLKAYWEKVIHLNTNIHILEKLNEFPWAVFTTRDKRIFFTQTFETFMNDSVVLANGILGDEKNNTTITIFMGEIRKNLVREEFLSSFQRHLKEVKATVNFGNLNTKEGLLGRLNSWRSVVIAHFKEWRLSQNGLPPDVTKITFPDLIHVVNVINTLFHSLTFNVEYIVHQMDYNPNVIHNQPYRTDIEEILDLIAKESTWLNMPERNSVQWRYLQPSLQPNEIYVLNKYRIKFGLQPV